MIQPEPAAGTDRLLSGASTRVVLSGAALLVVLGVFAAATGISPRGMAMASLTLAACWLPGTAIARAALAGAEPSLSVLVWGALLGLTSLRLAMVPATLALGAGASSVLAALACVVALGILAGRFAKQRHGGWPEEERREAGRLLVLLGLAVAVIIPPYWGLARLTARGYAFVPYFNHDLLSHLAVAAEVARAIPPENPYFAGQPLHYYWLHHLWPAAIMRLGASSAIEAIKLTNLFTILLFVSVLFVFVRRYVAEPWARVLAILLGLFAYSYVGLLFLASVMLPGAIERALPTHFGSMPSLLSHSWFRDFLYEPHALTALSLLMFAGYVAHRPEAARSPRGQSAAGMALVAALASDSFVGGIGILWYGMVVAGQLWHKTVPWSRAMLAGLVTGGLLLGFVLLGMFPLGGGVGSIAPHPALRAAPLYLLVELGPLFLFGLAGVVLAVGRARPAIYRDQVLLLGLALVVGFFVSVRGVPNHAIRKAIKVAQVPLVVLSGLALAPLWSLGQRRWHRPLLSGAALLGTVTLGTDVYQHSRLEGGPDREQPVTYVSSSEMRSLEWIRTETAPAAVFQSVSEVRPGKKFFDSFFCLISALGERRTLFGNYLMPSMLQVPQASIAQRTRELERLFDAADGQTAGAVLERLRPDYLWVDAREPRPGNALSELVGCHELHEVHRDGPILLLKVETGGCLRRATPEWSEPGMRLLSSSCPRGCLSDVPPAQAPVAQHHHPSDQSAPGGRSN